MTVDYEKVAAVFDLFRMLNTDEAVSFIHTAVLDPDIEFMQLFEDLISQGCPGCNAPECDGEDS